MARPCGCGDTCTCIIEGGLGIDTAGAGTLANPITIDFDGSEVVGQGMQWLNNQLSTKIVPGGGIEYDPQGAMFTTGGGGGSGAPLDLVTPLEARPAGTLIGGLMGAGTLVRPESFRRAYTAGVSMGLDLMHASVRFLTDGTPVVCWDESLGRNVYHPYNINNDHWRAIDVASINTEFWDTLPHPSGMYDSLQAWQPESTQDPLARVNWERARYHTNAPIFGWFGYMSEPQYGGTYLADILNICRDRTPLMLHIQWPALVQQPTAIGPWKTHLFLAHMRSLILRFRMQQQVVVVVHSSGLTIPPETGSTNTDVLAWFRSSGIRVGPLLTDAAGMAAYPPSSFAARQWTWALLPSTASLTATVKTYADAGIHSIISPVNRQYFYDTVVVPSSAKGVLSSDPLYYGAALPDGTHALSSYTYRRTITRWSDHVVPNGLFNPFEADVTRQSPFMRGRLKIEPNNAPQNQMYFGPEMTGNVGRTYWTLHGYFGPLSTPTNWGFDFQMQMDNPGYVGGTAANDWMGFAFGVPTDHALADWDEDGQVPPRPGRSLDTGYAFYMAQNNLCYVTWLDRGVRGGTVSFSMLTGTQPGDAGRKRFKVCVEPRGILVAAVTGDGGWTTLATMTTEPYQRFRGQYVYFGRFARTGAGWTGRVLEPFWAPDQGTAWWNAARPRAAELAPPADTDDV